MATGRNIGELRAYIRSLKEGNQRAYFLALINIANDAEGIAKRNSTQQFIGRQKYTLSGRLLNSIKHGYDMSSDKPTAWVGTVGIPYGAVHEYGDTIKPKKAKHLWQSLPDRHIKGSKFRRMTPSDFMAKTKSRAGGEGSYFFYRNKSTNKLIAAHALKKGRGKNARYKFSALFYLRKEVKIPSRPYLEPAVKQALNKAPAHLLRYMWKGRKR